ncbi:hypothetical protein C0992_011430 [Termitomyces sp. T32_za158]|nr:hypothetical protein C0992_011430 [Termitomyces sp. T32_za158]
MEDSGQPKAALITPSASPPHSYPHSKPHRIADQASPTKRPRLSSAPRQIRQRASPSSFAQNETFNFCRAREESAMRLFDVWAGLAERHSRRLDEDDIIDITTGKVVKDRGILRSSQTCSVGAFSNPTAEDAEDELEEDEEDDVDELDSFATPAFSDMEAPLLADLRSRDAQDIKEFLEAEQRRREIYGSEGDETEGSTYESQPEDTIEEFGRADLEGVQTPEPQEPVYVDSGSEDELGGWDLKEASALYRLPKDDSDSEVEVLNNVTQQTQLSPEVPLPPWTSPIALPRHVSKQRQLQTPPQSHSPVPSVTPDNFSDYPPPTSSPRSSPLPRSSSPFSQYESSPIKSRPAARRWKQPISDRKRTSPSRAQPHPIPSLDLSKVSAEPLVESKHVYQTLSNSSKARSSDSASINTKKQSRTSIQPANKGKTKQPLSDVEVPTRRHTSFRAPSQRRNDVSREKETKPKPPTTAKAKGKQKAASTDERVTSSQEDLVQRSSPPPASKSSPSHDQSSRSLPNYSSASQAEPWLDGVGSSSRKPKPKPKPLEMRWGPTSGGKRKRVVSSAETVEETQTSLPESSTEDIERQYSRPRHRSTDASKKPDIIQGTGFVPFKYEIRGKQSLRRRLPSAESESDGASQEEEVEPGQRHSSRAPSQFNSPYHPYPPQLYPTHPPPDQQRPIYTPLHDPRAQYIFTQAMQQIFALGGGAWGPPPPPARGLTPFTPKYRRRQREDHPPLHIYSTPMHHPHPYPFSYDPMLSHATLPPSSPEMLSSPSISASSGQPRRKSLVERSRSRGRRVSFREEESDIDASSGPEAYSDGALPPDRQNTSRSGLEECRRKGKGKDSAYDESLMSDSEAKPEPAPKPFLKERGRPPKRHQTPGPSSHEKDSPRDIRRVPFAHQNRAKSRA